MDLSQRFALLDSVALLDNFRWNLKSATVGTHK